MKTPAPTPPPDALADHLAAVKMAGDTIAGKSLPPVHLWNPPHCGSIGLRIARDGRWFYQGSVIQRPAMVRLFSTILRKDPDEFVLVTPVEKISIEVEDAPFLAVEMKVEGAGADQVISLRTNVDDWVTLDGAHPLRVDIGSADGLKPYVLIRGDLWALLTRALVHDLVALAQTQTHDGQCMFGVMSAGHFMPLARADQLDGLA